jgi:hypothetical protein
MNLFWRTVSPGHVDCHASSECKASSLRLHIERKTFALMLASLRLIIQSTTTGLISAHPWIERPHPTTSKSSGGQCNLGHAGSDDTLIPGSEFFTWMNDYLRGKFPLKRVRSGPLRKRAELFNPPFRLLDIWPMSVKRPDAHMLPGSDCLHWCETGVTDEWFRVGHRLSSSLASCKDCLTLNGVLVPAVLAYDHGRRC